MIIADCLLTGTKRIREVEVSIVTEYRACASRLLWEQDWHSES